MAYRGCMSLAVRVLGPLEVERDGRRVEPGSRKQRALLIDLLVHRGQTLSRDRLIDDLWAGKPPATAAGVVQNYISQLRKSLGATVVRTSGPGYAIDIEADALDIVIFADLVEQARAALDAGDVEGVGERTRAAMGLWRGEPLADVSAEPFARAEIARLVELRAAAVQLGLEAELAAGHYDGAAARLEAELAKDPLRERLWLLLMLALYRSGRQADALRAFQRARTLLSEELGIEPGVELRDLELAILQQRPAPDRLRVERTGGRPRAGQRQIRPQQALVGRADELAGIAAFLAAGGGGLLLLVGQAGIGKTRLLEEAQRLVREGIVIAGRGFEAEHGRPYGPWVDALRSAAVPAPPDSLRVRLAPLLPELSSEPSELDDPNRLYDAVVALLLHLCQTAPTVIVLDDAHWLDAPSVALLHFALRHLADSRVSFLAATRPAELADNPALGAMLDALRRDDSLRQLPVGPLAASTIGELTRPIAPNSNAEQIAEASQGNPLLAIEMARAMVSGDDPLTSRLGALIAGRLSRLGEQARALVPWMAAFGRTVAPVLLASAMDRQPSDLLEPLAELEAHGVLQPAPDATYDFTHDLVRTAAYRRISPPRRTMLHARIGVVLSQAPDPDDLLAAEAARHADAGADSLTCAAACVRAARRCLRLLAYRDAQAHVEMGRAHARRLTPVDRIPLEVQLIHALLHPGLRLRQAGDLGGDLTEVCAQAQRLGLDADLSSALQLLARLHHWAWGDIPRARALMQRAAKIMQAAAAPDIEPLLEGARCLAYLEMDMERTYQLFNQLEGLHDLATASHQYQWGLGLVRAWAGEIPQARAALGRAIELATAYGDHWASFECTARLAMLNLEADDSQAARAGSDQLATLAAKLGESGSEPAFADAIAALVALTGREPQAGNKLAAAVAELNRIGARFLTPDLLGIAAELEYRAGDHAAAASHAEQALAAADAVDRPLEVLRAHALLACLAACRGDLDHATQHLATTAGATLPGHVAALRHQAEKLIGRNN